MTRYIYANYRYTDSYLGIRSELTNQVSWLHSDVKDDRPMVTQLSIQTTLRLHINVINILNDIGTYLPHSCASALYFDDKNRSRFMS